MPLQISQCIYQKFTYSFNFCQPFITAFFIQIAAINAMHGCQHIVKGIFPSQSFICSCCLLLHSDLDSQKHFVTAIRAKPFKIFVYIKHKCTRIRRVIIVPVLSDNDANILLLCRSDGLGNFHMTIAGIITMHMCVKNHILANLS